MSKPDSSAGASTYDISALSALFGVSRGLVESWVRRGLLGKCWGGADAGEGAYFTQASVQSFIRRHPRQYDLRRVNRAWFTGMVFSGRAGREVEGERCL